MDIDQVVIDMLADKSPAKARDMMLAWAERRNSSWSNAAREAQARAGSDWHVPQIRGQLRFHLGEAALADAAYTAGAGVIPLRSQPPGGVCNVARIGRFALVSLIVRYPGLLPRRSITRKLLSEPNEAIDPNLRLPLEDSDRRVITELAYFGCLTAVPSAVDPSVPAILALAIPNKGLTGWISWIPFHRLHALLQEWSDFASSGTEPGGGFVPDLAFPKFRLPKSDIADDKKKDS